MKNRIAAFSLVTAIVAVTLLLPPARAQENSSTSPAAVGTRVRSMIELGSVYSNIYDITVTVLETVRGENAMERLKTASPDNKMPPEGFEYVLAHIKFEMKGRAVSDKMALKLGDDPLQWVALSSELYEYAKTPVTAPKPALAGTVAPGSFLEGWVAFTVEQKDKGPVMVFDPDTGGATGRGRTLFFKLY